MSSWVCIHTSRCCRYSSSKFISSLYRTDEYIVNRKRCEPIGYLAQHCLFEQIEELRRDIVIPDYCSLLNDDDEKPNSEDVIVNAWLVIISYDATIYIPLMK